MSDNRDADVAPAEDAPGKDAPESGQTPEAVAPDEATAPKPTPRPRSATSRARRIGGAAATAATPAAEPATSDAEASEPADATTSLRKRRTAEPAAEGTKDKPARSAKAAMAAKSSTTSKASRSATSTTADDTPAGDVAGRRQVTLSVPAWLRWAPGFAFLAVAIAFLALFVADRVGNDTPSTTSSTARQEVLAAAKKCLATVNTYRYNQLDEARKAGTACTTGKLTTDYQNTVTNVIGKNAPGLKAVQLAKINAAGIESVTKNGKQWTVLAYGQLNITTANTGAQGRVDPFAVVARLQQVRGEWKLSKIDTVSSFSS